MKPETKSVKLADIRMDGGTQTRAELSEKDVEEYAERMVAGDKFPAVVLFHDGSDYWLADGFHRCHACRKAGYLDVLSIVNTGTRRDAVKFAIQANHNNSIRRTNKDKQFCVSIALKEYPDLSDRALADWCGVSDPFVAKVRREQVQTVSTSPETNDLRDISNDLREEHEEEDASEQEETRTGKDGKQYPAPVKEPISPEEPAPTENVPSEGMVWAEKAIKCLSHIQHNDIQKKRAYRHVSHWLQLRNT